MISSIRPTSLPVAPATPAPATEAPAGPQRLGDVPSGDRLQVSLILKRQKQIEVSPDPFNPPTRSGMSAAPNQVSEVEAFAAKTGLKVASVDPQSHTVKLEGTAAALGKAFGVTVGRFQSESGRAYRGYEGKLKLPQGVDAVLGLDDRPIAKPHIVMGAAPDVTTNAFTGPRIADLYSFPKGTDGSGQTIGIIELGGGYKTDDLRQYFRRANVPMPDVKAVSVDGATNKPEGNANSADGEVALDIEVAGGAAPGAKQVVYFAPNTDQGFVDAINQAIHDTENHPNTISISWGAPEKEWTPEAMAAMNNAFRDAAALGINVYCASGDSGSQDGEKDGKNHADFPAASPWVIGCGGTKLETADGHIKSEKVWRDMWGFGGSTGGGVSDFHPAQPWQTAHAHVPPSQTGGGGRGVPDVAGNASPTSGYLVIVDGKEIVTGGTSAVSPLYAALNARLAQGVGGQLGYLASTIYEHPEAFHDITEGNNGDYKAGPGWDATTGVGSPDGQKLLDVLKQKAAENAAE